MKTTDDGKTVAEGSFLCHWNIRQWPQHDGTFAYDWIADTARGNYDESDELFDSIEDAKEDLGVN